MTSCFSIPPIPSPPPPLMIDVLCAAIHGLASMRSRVGWGLRNLLASPRLGRVIRLQAFLRIVATHRMRNAFCAKRARSCRICRKLRIRRQMRGVWQVPFTIPARPAIFLLRSFLHKWQVWQVREEKRGFAAATCCSVLLHEQ